MGTVPAFPPTGPPRHPILSVCLSGPGYGSAGSQGPASPSFSPTLTLPLSPSPSFVSACLHLCPSLSCLRGAGARSWHWGWNPGDCLQESRLSRDPMCLGTTRRAGRGAEGKTSRRPGGPVQ